MYTLLVTGDVPGASTYFNPLLQQTIIPCTSGARPSSPPDGMMIYETDTRFFRSWNSTISSWVLTGSNRQLYARKTTDQPRQNNTSPSADSELVINNVPAGTWYVLRGIITYNGDVAADMKGGVFGPAGATFQGIHRAPNSAATATPSTILTDSTTLGNGFVFGCISTPQDIGAEIDGTFYSGAGGSCGFTWSQNNSNSSPTTVKAGSYLMLTPMG